MWLISIQYTNLGVLGSTSIPVQLDLQDPNFALMESMQKRELPVVLVAGNNGSGKTTLCAGIYFALRGNGTLNGRQIPKGIMTAGTREMAVALTVRHAGQAARFSSKHHSYQSDRITLVRAVITRQDGNDYSYYIVDGCYNLEEPYPYGTKVSAENYQRVLEAMGVNEGVLHAYEETLEQGSISKLADAAAKDSRQMFDLLCRVIGATNARKDYEINRRKTRDALILLQREIQSLNEKKMELDRLLRKKADYERLKVLRERLEASLVEYTHAEVQMYLVQQLLYETRTTILDQQIINRENEIERLRKTILSLQETLNQVTLNHGQLREKQQKIQNEIGHAQTELGQYQALYQASREVVDNTPSGAMIKSVEEWSVEVELLRDQTNEVYVRVKELRGHSQEIHSRLLAMRGQTSFERFPTFVKDFCNELSRLGINYHLLADVLNIKELEWHTAVESYLGPRRFWVMVAGGKQDFDRAYKIVEQMRYQPGIRAPRPRLSRPTIDYQNTIWNILDLPEKEMNMWGYHLDDLGYQLMARSAEEARKLNQSRPSMRVFSPSGVVSQTDLFARSVLSKTPQEIALFCGKRAIELELKRLSGEKERLQLELNEAENKYAQTKLREDEATSLRHACANYHSAQQKLLTAQTALQAKENFLNSLSSQKVEIDSQVDQARDELEQLRNGKAEIDRQIERITGEIGQARATRSGSASQLRQEPNVPVGMLTEERQSLERIIGEPILNEQRASKLETMVREIREALQNVEGKIQTISASIQEIPEHASLDETIPPKCEALQAICSSVSQAIEEKRIIFQTNLRAAESEYLLLQQEMTRAVALVEQQANRMSGPLLVDFRVRLLMPDASFFKIEGDEFGILEQINALEGQTMAVDVKVRFSKDVRRDFRGVGDAWASGGQQEIACAALLGGILFAAQQMHAQTEITGTDWEKAPLLLLDEPFENLDIVNRRTMIGSLLMLPVQIIVLYPMPPLEFIQSADVVITVEKSSGAGNPTLLRLTRGVRAMNRSEFANVLRGDAPNAMAA